MINKKFLVGAGLLLGGASVLVAKKVLSKYTDDLSDYDLDYTDDIDAYDLKYTDDIDDATKFEGYNVPTDLYERLKLANAKLTSDLNVEARLNALKAGVSTPVVDNTIKQGIPSIKGTPIRENFTPSKEATAKETVAPTLGELPVAEDDFKSLLADMDFVSIVMKPAILVNAPQEMNLLINYDPQNITVEGNKVRGAVDYYDFKVKLHCPMENVKALASQKDNSAQVLDLLRQTVTKALQPVLKIYATPYVLTVSAQGADTPVVKVVYRSTDYAEV